ncbi:MAG: hypothetical protein ACXACY_13035 [Candidatus Hodarchaeales archaeon]|jgi:hypothetical protein
MNELIKYIQQALKEAENQYDSFNKKIEQGNMTITDNERRLYWIAQMNAYNNILDYIKQDKLS